MHELPQDIDSQPNDESKSHRTSASAEWLMDGVFDWSSMDQACAEITRKLDEEGVTDMDARASAIIDGLRNAMKPTLFERACDIGGGIVDLVFVVLVLTYFVQGFIGFLRLIF